MEEVYSDFMSSLIKADAFEYMKHLKDSTIDLIIADSSYFLSNDGISNSGGKMVSVNKGIWDKNTEVSPEEFYDLF